MKGKVAQKAAAPEIDTTSTTTLPKEIQTVALTSRIMRAVRSTIRSTLPDESMFFYREPSDSVINDCWARSDVHGLPS